MNTRPWENLYVHVPFCAGKCDYCAFYSEPDSSLADAWFEKLTEDAIRHASGTLPLKTVYFGGGTPTLLPPDRLERLFSMLEKHFRVTGDAEVSMECNPESLTPEKAKVMSGFVNRVSMGVQSFDEEKRRLIGRRGDVRKLESALGMLRTAGMENIGMDLIYELPSQTLREWRGELEKAVSFGIRHLSAYSLSIEENTPLARRFRKNGSEELGAEMGELAVRFLSEHGLERYEISNYAQPGFECRHNWNVWHGGTYLGLGPSACSFDGRVRWTEVSPVQSWLAGEAPEMDEIPEEKRLAEIWVMGLRTVRGWKKGEFNALTGVNPEDHWREVLDRLTAEGFLASLFGRIALSERGLAFWNDAAAEFF